MSTPDAPASPLYSQGVAAGPFLFVSGMTGIEVTTGLAGRGIREQTTQALSNCVAILEAGGASVDAIVQVTVLLARPEDFAGMNEAYAAFFGPQPPARAVAKLGVELPNILISIMMTAYREPNSGEGRTGIEPA
ncbi:RidA family protein [Pseudolysinimonas kribbensis]|uniref:Reactive intermediate/imine deaminase n=1 Tax=Pseudolysinimonas kribbensis TaxID=433641 RepID=A0ABQ6K8Y5_9MICO|nr:reactive intermediate/imine deaminase [Pseudolysinimonas kribbensis]